MDCSKFNNNSNSSNSTETSFFEKNYCITNNNIEWIFILNTLVLSLIYLYFLLLQHLSKLILTTTIKMELDL